MEGLLTGDKELSSGAAAKLYKLGKEAWNNFMEEHEVKLIVLDDYVNTNDFSGFVFPSKLRIIVDTHNRELAFCNAIFQAEVEVVSKLSNARLNFTGAHFKGHLHLETKRRDGFIKLDFNSAVFEKGLVLRNHEIHSLTMNGAHFKSGFIVRNSVVKSKLSAVDCVFEKLVMMVEVIVDCRCILRGSKFHGEVSIHSCKFDSMVSFMGCSFSDQARFLSSSFNVSIHLENASFARVPKFYQSNIPPEAIGGIKVEYQSSDERQYLFFRKAKGAGDAQAYRHLKQLSITSKDHGSELAYFSMEMRAKRWHEDMPVLDLIANYFYQGASNYGRSIFLPLFWYLLAIVVCAIGYYKLAAVKSVTMNLLYSLFTTIPFGGLSKKSATLHDTLFPQHLFDCESFVSTYYSLALINGLLGFVFLFLIGLGLRNQFRL